MSAFSNYLASIPKYKTDGSENPVALGGLVAVAAGGWVENKGPTTIYLVPIGDEDAKKDPVSRGKTVLANSDIPLAAGMVLSEWGLLAEGPLGAGLAIGS